MNSPPITPETRAWEVLHEVEMTDFHMSMAEERAACGGLSAPVTISDYLFWLEDEAEIQEAQAESWPDEEESERHALYAIRLRTTAEMLHELGFSPTHPERETVWDMIPMITAPIITVPKTKRLSRQAFLPLPGL